MRRLRRAIETFDGRETSGLAELAGDSAITKPEHTTALLELLRDANEKSQSAASWVLLFGHRKHKHLTAKHAVQLSKRLSEVTAWDAQLNLLQTLHLLPLPKNLRAGLYESLLTLCQSRKTFVRAWALSAGYVLARLDSRYARELDAMIAQAEKNDTAAVRARIRRVRKDGAVALESAQGRQPARGSK